MNHKISDPLDKIIIPKKIIQHEKITTTLLANLRDIRARDPATEPITMILGDILKATPIKAAAEKFAIMIAMGYLAEAQELDDHGELLTCGRLLLGELL
jgi:hypothetical protein